MIISVFDVAPMPLVSDGRYNLQRYQILCYYPLPPAKKIKKMPNERVL